MEEENENNKALVEDLRKRLLSRGPELHQFNQKDIDNVQKNDLYVWLFLKHKDKDVEKALEMMVDCLKWREEFGINALMERNIDRRLFEIGFLYPHNKDKNGNPLLLFHTKLYKKELYDLNEVKKLFAFGLEKMACNNRGKKVTLIFDMQDAGFSNMDMDLVKFVITCFQTYFASMLEYLIVFETPWMLTAAWKIVKTWLSTEGISKIKFTNKTEIFQYVAPDQLLTSMGGTDDFVYKYPPQLFSNIGETFESPKMRNKYAESLLPVNKVDVFSSMSMSVDATNLLKQSEEFAHVKHNDDVHSSIERSITDSFVKPVKIDEKLKNKKEVKPRKNNLEKDGPLVTISPASELIFYGPSSTSSEPLQIITITNTISSPVAFKVKTTSPESFRVRPSSGPISPGCSVEVHVNLHPGHEASVAKDKFLIMSTIIPDQEKNDLSSMWKDMPRSSIMEQRLRCRYDSSGSQSIESDRESYDTTLKNTSPQDPLLIISKHLMDFDNKIGKIQNKMTSLERGVKLMFGILLLFLFLLILTVCSVFLFLSRDVLRHTFS